MLDSPVIAHWFVAGETYQEMWDEALADAELLMRGSPRSWELELVNLEPKDYEDSRIITWKGTVILSQQR